MTWSEMVWERTQPIYNRIIQMPFILELITGDLDKEKFRFYIAQDSVYLEHFGKALALIGARTSNIEESLAFFQFAENAIVVENALHASYFGIFGIAEKGFAQPACHHYTHFLKSTAALAPVEVAMAAVLPCFWIYKAVGDHIVKHQSGSENPYQAWIDTYGGEDFAIAVKRAISICDGRAGECGSVIRAEMTDAFITACQLEFDFWDASYHLRVWR